jgi:hypothetical protein
VLSSNNPTQRYADIKAVGAHIAANQITNGGPVILVQAENEYSGWQPPYSEDFVYETDLKSILVAPIISTYLLFRPPFTAFKWNNRTSDGK